MSEFLGIMQANKRPISELMNKQTALLANKPASEQTNIGNSKQTDKQTEAQLISKLLTDPEGL